MTTRHLPLLLCVLLCGGSSLNASALDKPTELFKRWEEQGYGQFSGRVQTLIMHRDRDDAPARHGTSGTTAFTLNYLSPQWEGLSFGAQGIVSLRLFENGNRATPAYSLLVNDDHHDMNELFVRAQLDEWFDLFKDTQLTVGRQILNYDFAPRYEIRQKAQSFEAAVLRLREWKDWTLDLGHLERFSSWASREGGPSTLRADFVDVADTLGVGYGAKGFQFASVGYTGWESTKLSMYDYYGQDLMNTAGVKFAHKWAHCESAYLELQTHFAYQYDVGRMDNTATGGRGGWSTHNGEIALEYGQELFTGRVGVNTVGSDDFLVPFRSTFTIDPELLWYTRQFDAQTDSLFLRTTYKKDKWFLYMLGVLSDRDRTAARAQMDAYEVDAVVKYTFNSHVYVTVKAGYGEQDPANAPAFEAKDLRLFVGYTF